MDDHLADTEVPIEYLPQVREYQIVASTGAFGQLLNYCPWCGSRLPMSLREVWGERLDQLGIYDPLGDEKERVPPMFQDDSWWRLEGL
jgi:hypothetical protein